MAKNFTEQASLLSISEGNERAQYRMRSKYRLHHLWRSVGDLHN